MAEYTKAEKADMILAYGATDCNGRAAHRLYAERHPVRRTPAHTLFARLHQQLCETGSFQKAARNGDLTARTELNEKIALDVVETTPSLTTRGLFTVVITATNCKSLFAASVLFTDEASFSREGIFNTHNSHSWAAANPHVTCTRAAQDRFLVKIWAGILGDHLIGPYILPDRLTGPRYLIFLEQVLPELLDSAHVTAATRTSMWFHQDGAPHISVFLFGITWMQHVVNDGLAVEVSALASPIARPFLSGLFLLGANEMLGVRNTRKQRRGTCSTHQCSSRGNTKHSRNVIECSTLHEAKM
ncbi:DUF4817 domain-containing protein [Trichonephila clavipes]|nr:DUF4817 domain-containing protein [Trichonephila clavipes]